MDTFLKRQKNKEILELLTLLVDKYPDWNFHQILQNSGTMPYAIPEIFYEESSETLNRMLDTPFMQCVIKFLKK